MCVIYRFVYIYKFIFYRFTIYLYKITYIFVKFGNFWVLIPAKVGNFFFLPYGGIRSLRVKIRNDQKNKT